MRTIEELVEYIDELLYQKKKTRTELLSEIGASHTLFSMSLKRKGYLSLEFLCKISEVLNVPLAILLDIDDRNDVPVEVLRLEQTLKKLSDKDVKLLTKLAEYLLEAHEND